MLEPYQKRVVYEHRALALRLKKLKAFINSGDTFRAVNPGEQTRLIQQQQFMQSYKEVLAERIAAFKQESRHGR